MDKYHALHKAAITGRLSLRPRATPAKCRESPQRTHAFSGTWCILNGKEQNKQASFTFFVCSTAGNQLICKLYSGEATYRCAGWLCLHRAVPITIRRKAPLSRANKGSPCAATRLYMHQVASSFSAESTDSTTFVASLRKGTFSSLSRLAWLYWEAAPVSRSTSVALVCTRRQA